MDNERPIEKLLRRYAKKRRDDPAATGLELHPATRRLLQGEVARQFEVRGAKGQETGSSPDPSHLTPRTLTNLWPRLVWALPVLVALGVGTWVIVQSRKSQEGVGNLAKTESASPVELREALGRSETPARSVGGVTPPNESAPTALADATGSRAKDSTRTFGREEAKLKTDGAPALAVNAPTPSVAPNAATLPEVANVGKTVQEKAPADREARFARDASADRSRDLTLSTRQTPAQEPATRAAEKVEAARTLPAAATEDLGVARRIGDRPGTAGAEIAGVSARATPRPAAPAPLSLPTKPGLTLNEMDRSQAAPETVVQKFVQTTAVLTSGSLAKKNAETSPVLETFQLEQTGNQLRVVDSDGSSYNGSIQFATTDSLHDAAGETKKADDFKNAPLYRQTLGQKGLEAQTAQNFFFSVAGTNRTLKQPVAFTGNLLVITNALPMAQTGVTLAPAAKIQLPQGQSVSPSLLNSSISGKVQLGADKELQIRAVPVAR